MMRGSNKMGTTEQQNPKGFQNTAPLALHQVIILRIDFLKYKSEQKI